MTIDHIIDRFTLGEIWSADLPDIAIQLLESEYDVPSLRQLAASRGDDHEYLRSLFVKTVHELHLALPKPSEAAYRKARIIAQEILDKKISPYLGASIIWHDIYTAYPKLKDLLPFVGLASEYEDDDAHREAYLQDIIDFCSRFLAEYKM